MQANLAFKILFLLICLCAFALVAVAQEKKPEATLIGEHQFSDESDDNDFSAFERMTEQLIFRLTQEPATTAGLINIMERSVWGERVKAILSKHPELKNKISYGSPNESRYKIGYKASFWIVPLGAKMPDVGSGEPPCICPTLDVSGDPLFDGTAGNLIFTATVEGKNQKEIKYRWDVSAGKIIEGQGTKTITVKPQGADKITATVRIGGTCDDEICPLTGSAITYLR